MISLETLVVAIVLVGFAQDSIQDQFLPVALSVSGVDQLPDSTPRKQLANCKFLCRSKRKDHLEKKTSFPLCIKECSRRKRTGESLSSVDKQTELKSPMSRSRRNTEKQEKECLKHNKGYPHTVVVPKSQINVDFVKSKPNLTIDWKPVYGEYGYNWTSYNLIYHKGGAQDQRSSCVLIPKDKHEWVIRDGDGWRYPEPIVLAIITHPGYYNSFNMEIYGPPPPKPPTMPPPEGTPSIKVIVAVSGLVAGIVLLLVILVIYRKRGNSCSFFLRGSSQGDLLGNHRINNSCCAEEDEVNDNLYPMITNDLKLSGPEFFYACYYPENERFQLQVASVVNFFRENGYKVVMDVMSCNELVNLGPTRWAEQQIKKAHKILVFLSPGLLRMCGGTDDNDTQSYSQEHERLWYELSLLRTIYSQTHSAARMICISLPQRTAIDARDLPLWAELRYRWPEDKRRILNRLNDRPIIQPL